MRFPSHLTQIYEKRPNFVKTYGVVLKYQSRTGQHNMYKEFRDTSLNGAIGQLYMEMSGNHRANHDTVHVVRSTVLTNKSQIRRSRSLAFRQSKLRFPIVKTIARSSQKKYRTVFKAHRPNTYKS
jgi:large subunit ribosomal protein L18Ae